MVCFFSCSSCLICVRKTSAIDWSGYPCCSSLECAFQILSSSPRFVPRALPSVPFLNWPDPESCRRPTLNDTSQCFSCAISCMSCVKFHSSSRRSGGCQPCPSCRKKIALLIPMQHASPIPVCYFCKFVRPLSRINLC